MRLTLHIRAPGESRAFVERAVAGIVATTAEAEEVVAALLEVLDGRRYGPPRREAATRRERLDTPDVVSVHRELGGSIKATAKALGCARSTVRAHLARAAANDNGGQRRTG